MSAESVTDQLIISQIDLARIRSDIAAIKDAIGTPTVSETGEIVGGTGLVGDFNRFRVKAERRFSMYDRWGWFLMGAGAMVAASASVVWFLISDSAPVNDLKARPVEVHAR